MYIALAVEKAIFEDNSQNTWFKSSLLNIMSLEYRQVEKVQLSAHFSNNLSSNPLHRLAPSRANVTVLYRCFPQCRPKTPFGSQQRGML